MSHAMTDTKIALKDLTLHETNVRAKSPETYEADNIAHLKASIAALGLIQPLVVQKQEAGYGVLAGGRRLAALKALAADKAQKGQVFKVASSTKIDCRVVPDNCDVNTAISLAENVTQAPMTAIDEYEAFANMMEIDGQTPETIALTFGTTVAAVKERLRYARVHPDIRAAVRAKTLTIDTMKAFGNHPGQDAQLEVFTALSKDDAHINAWQVTRALNERGVQVSDDLGKFIVEDYKEAEGPIAADLLEDNSVLEDKELVSSLLETKLRKIAEAECEAGGFAWADVMILQTAYNPEDLKSAGVIVSWNNGVMVSKGLVRPEDKKGAKGSGVDKTEDVDPGDITYAASLEADLKTERGV